MNSENPITNIAHFFKNIDYDRIINNAGLILEYIKKQAVKGGQESTRTLLELYFVMMNDNTTKFNKLLIGVALAYQVLPNDFFPTEDYGILGVFDNAAAIYFAYKRVKKSITPEIRQKVEETLADWEKSVKEFTIMKPESERI
ncbi:MAG: DUF1232 domain-containing protein [Prevotella sp.]|nr:DUF1232 domain-containing protein [Prevotella sp.]